jgi:hypothetical protein
MWILGSLAFLFAAVWLVMEVLNGPRAVRGPADQAPIPRSMRVLGP